MRMGYFYNVRNFLIEFWKTEKECAHKGSIWELCEQLLTFGGTVDVIFLSMFIYVFYFYDEFVLLWGF